MLAMKMETGQWYVPRYSGRKASLYKVKHTSQAEIILEIWEFDKKSRGLILVDPYVPMDEQYFQITRDSEGLVLLDDELRQELNMTEVPV